MDKPKVETNPAYDLCKICKDECKRGRLVRLLGGRVYLCVTCITSLWLDKTSN